MEFMKLYDIFKKRCNTVHTFTCTKKGRKLLITSIITFILLFLAPLFRGSVGATLVGSVMAPMTILIWRRYDKNHSIVPAVYFTIPMILDMLLYMNIKTATSLLISIIAVLLCALSPAFSYIRKIEDNTYAYLYAGCVCAGIVIVSWLITWLVSIAWWLFCLILFVVLITVFFSVVFSTAAYTATDRERQKRKRELREYDLQESSYDFDVFAHDIGLRPDTKVKRESSSRRKRRESENALYYDVED